VTHIGVNDQQDTTHNSRTLGHWVCVFHALFLRLSARVSSCTAVTTAHYTECHCSSLYHIMGMSVISLPPLHSS